MCVGDDQGEGMVVKSRRGEEKDETDEVSA